MLKMNSRRVGRLTLSPECAPDPFIVFARENGRAEKKVRFIVLVIAHDLDVELWANAFRQIIPWMNPTGQQLPQHLSPRWWVWVPQGQQWLCKVLLTGWHPRPLDAGEGPQYPSLGWTMQRHWHCGCQDCRSTANCCMPIHMSCKHISQSVWLVTILVGWTTSCG